MKKMIILVVTCTTVLGITSASYGQNSLDNQENKVISDRINTQLQRNLQTTVTLMNSILLLLNLLLVGTGLTIWLMRKVVIDYLVNISSNKLENFMEEAQAELTENLNKSILKQAEFINDLETRQKQSIDKFQASIVDEAKILIQEIKGQQNLLEQAIIRFQNINNNQTNQGNNIIEQNIDEKSQLLKAYDYFNQGNEFFSNHRYEEANNYYNEALKIDRNLGDIRYQNARCYALRRNANLAIGNLQWAIDLNPEYQKQAQTDFAFDLIRSDANFRKIMQ